MVFNPTDIKQKWGKTQTAWSRHWDGAHGRSDEQGNEKHMNRQKVFHGHCTFIYYMWWSGCTLHGIWRLVNIKWEKFCLYCLYIYLDFHRIQWTPDLVLELQLQHGHIYIICICIVGGGLCSVFPRWRKTDTSAHDLTAARNFVPPLTSPPVSRAERIFSQSIPFLKTREIKNGKMGIEVKLFSIILQWS